MNNNNNLKLNHAMILPRNVSAFMYQIRKRVETIAMLKIKLITLMLLNGVDYLTYLFG